MKHALRFEKSFNVKIQRSFHFHSFEMTYLNGSRLWVRRKLYDGYIDKKLVNTGTGLSDQYLRMNLNEISSLTSMENHFHSSSKWRKNSILISQKSLEMLEDVLLTMLMIPMSLDIVCSSDEYSKSIQIIWLILHRDNSPAILTGIKTREWTTKEEIFISSPTLSTCMR